MLTFSIIAKKHENADLSASEAAEIDLIQNQYQTNNNSMICTSNEVTPELNVTYTENSDAPLNILEVYDNDNQSPLHRAARHNRIKAAELLIQYGANVNSKALNGITPLLCACFGQHIEMIDLLIQYGARLDEPCYVGSGNMTDGATALHMVCQRNLPDVVVALINRGASLRATNIHGLTPLHYALYSNSNVEIIELLLKADQIRKELHESGFDVNSSL